MEYLQSTPLETRRAEADSILDKYQDRVPVIFDRGSPDAPKVDRHKLLCALDIYVEEFAQMVRKKIEQEVGQEVFLPILFFGDDRTLPRTSVTMRDVYDEHKADDGFLYVEYQMPKIGCRERDVREEMRVFQLQEQLRRARR